MSFRGSILVRAAYGAVFSFWSAGTVQAWPSRLSDVVAAGLPGTRRRRQRLSSHTCGLPRWQRDPGLGLLFL